MLCDKRMSECEDLQSNDKTSNDIRSIDIGAEEDEGEEAISYLVPPSDHWGEKEDCIYNEN